MERLTKYWNNNYVATKLNYDFVWELSEEDFKYFNDIIKKLAKYEDFEEHDKLIKLPCKVGDIVYNIVPLRNNNFTYREDEVSKIILEEDGIKIFFKNGLGKCVEDFGKTMFLTKEEMEKQIWLKK